MLHEILLKTIMFASVADFLLHGEECRKFGRYIINLGERTLEIKRLIIFYLCFTLALDNHIVHGHTILHALPHSDQVRAGYLTIANRC
jgi:hypothetical protein